MTDGQTGILKTFKPRQSMGWIWLVILAALFAGLGYLAMTAMGGISGSGLIVLIITGVIAFAFLALAVFFPSMRYELYADKLVLRYGPVINYSIPLAEIRAVRKTNLSMTIMSAIRFPGIALFKVPYGGEGDVKMCSTAALKNVLLIETRQEKFGLTPADQEELIAALQLKAGK